MRAVFIAASLLVAPAIAGDWTGFYAGLHAGYGAASHQVSEAGGMPGDTVSYDYEIAPDAGLAGAQIGYLHQFDRLVVGIEGAASTARFDESVGPIFGNGATLDYASFTAEWVASIRVKAGFALDDGLLVYAAGGVAFSNGRETAGASGGDFDPVETNRTGWVAGIGVALDLAGDWYGALDYAHYGFEGGDGAGWGSNAVRAADTGFDTVTLALNYRF